MLGLLSLAVVLSVCSAQQTWHIVGKNQDLDTIIIGVSFVNETTGWIPADSNGKGAVFSRSDDGGVTWKHLEHNGYVTIPAGIAMQNLPDGSANGVIGGVAFGRNFTVMEYTTDGYVFNAPSPNPDFYGASQDVKHITGVDKAFALTGYYEDTHLKLYNGLAATYDGGVTYTNYDIGFDDPLARYGSYPSSNIWYVAAGAWPELDLWDNEEAKVMTQKLRIHKKEGIQFRHDVLGSAEGMATLGSAASGRQLQQSYPYRAAIAKTTDAGKTWSTVYNDTAGAFYFNDISCPTVTSCWAVGEAEDDSVSPGIRILHTGDGGANWDVQLFINDGTFSLIEISMLSDQEGWAGGGYLSSRNFTGFFWHTSNGGKTWDVPQQLTDEYPMAFSFVQPQTGPYIGWASAFTREGGSSILTYS